MLSKLRLLQFLLFVPGNYLLFCCFFSLYIIDHTKRASTFFSPLLKHNDLTLFRSTFFFCFVPASPPPFSSMFTTLH